jgi:hypothetical protein
MSIQGLEGAQHIANVVRETVRPANGDVSGAAAGRTQLHPRPQPAQSARPVPSPAGLAPSEPVPVMAPPGTDPALWSVLTTEERAFFTRAQALGPLTYRPGVSEGASLPAVRGGRLDLRV